MLDNPQVLHAVCWAGAALLFVLAMPCSWLSKLILEVSAWALRLGVLGVLAAGAYLWFRPEAATTAEAQELYGYAPAFLRDNLPAPGDPVFGLCAATLLAAVCLPFLAAFDVTRQLAGRLPRLRQLGDHAPAIEQTVGQADAHTPAVVTEARPAATGARGTNLRSAADTIASAREQQQRRPNRVADYVK